MDPRGGSAARVPEGDPFLLRESRQGETTASVAAVDEPTAPRAPLPAQSTSEEAPPRTERRSRAGHPIDHYAQQVHQRLFATAAHHLQPHDVERFQVTIHRATLVEYGSVSWKQPQVLVSLGQYSAWSPEGIAFGDNPIFDWTTELKYSGRESHLVIEVYAEGCPLGCCYLPVHHVLREETGVLDRAVPLVRNGLPGRRHRQGNSHQRVRSEVFVTARAILAHRLDAQQYVWLEALHKACRQVRVTIRKLHLVPGEQEDSGALRPQVEVAVGTQSARSQTARVLQKEEAEEFVFADQSGARFTCGGLLKGVADTYEPRPVEPLRQRISGYRKSAMERALDVEYTSTSFTFWYAQHPSIEFAVFDVGFLGMRRQLCSASLAFEEVFLSFYPADLASMPKNFSRKVTMQADGLIPPPDAVDRISVGDLEVEFELLQDILATRSSFAATQAKIASSTLQMRANHEAALRTVSKIATGDNFNGTQFRETFRTLPDDLCEAMAVLLAAVGIKSARSVVEHEEDVLHCHPALPAVVEMICRLLRAPEATAASLQASVRSGLVPGGAEGALQRYTQLCVAHSLETVPPLVSFFAELRCTHGPHGAVLRTLFREAMRLLAPRSAVAEHTVDLLDRYLSMVAAETNLPSKIAVWTAEEQLEASRPLENDQGRATQAEKAQNVKMRKAFIAGGFRSFLPTIDCNVLLETSHPGDQMLMARHRLHQFWAALITMFLVAGPLGKRALQSTATIVNNVDEIVCDRRMTSVGLHGVCRFLESTGLQRAAQEYLQSPVAEWAFFAAFGGMHVAFTWDALARRWGLSQEFALEPLNQGTSDHILVCASGFLVSRADIFRPWEVEQDAPWTDGKVCVVRYETTTLSNLGFKLRAHAQTAAWRTYYSLQFLLAFTTPLAMVNFSLGILELELGEEFELACVKGEEAGKTLAKVLVQQGGKKTVSLFAFSASCCMIHSCLKELQSMAESGLSPVAGDIVVDVVLVGAPISAHNKEEWMSLRKIVSGRFIIGYARDPELLWHEFKHLTSYVGIHGLHDVPGIDSLALGGIISKHEDYLTHMPEILSMLSTR